MLKIDRSYHWFAVYTKSRREKELERDLIEDGFDVYLPKINRLRVWSDRKKWVEMPIFPGYIFVRVSNLEYYQVLSHPAAVKYVGFGGIPARIPERQLDAVKRILGLNLNMEVTTENFRKGEVVEINAGPMSGCRGEIINVSSKKKLLLRIQDIGYSLVVSVPPAYLEMRDAHMAASVRNINIG
jgi:transcription antitermination factor NusG